MANVISAYMPLAKACHKTKLKTNAYREGRDRWKGNKSLGTYNSIYHITFSELSPKPSSIQQKKINILIVHQKFIPKLVFPSLVNLSIQNKVQNKM